MAASRTFDITFTMKNGMAEHQFSNINREEQQPLENFFRAKGIKTKNEMADDSGAILAAALQDEDLASSDDGAPANRGSADEDDESVDEDFQADSESEVGEEFDSDHQSSGSDSDAEMDDAESEGDAAEAVPERPKKKQKVSQ